MPIVPGTPTVPIDGCYRAGGFVEIPTPPAAALPRMNREEEVQRSTDAGDPGGSPEDLPKVDDGASLLVEKEEPVASPNGEEDPEIKSENDEDAKLEIDPVRGARDLQEEAKSLKHKLTHLPKNPYCQACQ